MGPILPDEIIAKIIKESVRSWTLKWTRKTVYIAIGQNDLDSGDIHWIRDIPQLNNLKLVNRLFRDETQRAICDRFDGRLTIENYYGASLWEYWSKFENELSWLFPFITTIYMHKDDMRIGMRLIGRRFTPNLGHLIVDFGYDNDYVLYAELCGCELMLVNVLANSFDGMEILNAVIQQHDEAVVQFLDLGFVGQRKFETTNVSNIYVENVAVKVTFGFDLDVQCDSVDCLKPTRIRAERI